MSYPRRLSERLNRNHDGENGAVAVEFALIALPLFILIFGIIGFGIVFSQKQALSNAARDAARAGVVTYVTPVTCASIVTQAQNASQTLGLTPSAVGVTVTRGATQVCASTDVTPSTAKPCANAVSTDTTVNELTVRLTFASKVELLFMSPTYTLVGKGIFRCEYTQ